MYLIYGVGKIGRKYLKKCRENGIEDIIVTDSNKEKVGLNVEGYSVISIDEVDFNLIEMVIIATNEKHYNAIQEKLNCKKVKNIIVRYAETIILSNKEKYNWGDMVLKQNIETGIYSMEQFLNLFEKNRFNDVEKIVYEGQHRAISKWIHYLEAYDRFFSKYRGKKVKILEIGVYKGGSLQLWKKYFSKGSVQAQIYGIDINPECKELEEDNISIYIGSQEDREFLKKVKREIGEVDIIIDDGGHTMNQQIVSFEELFDLLSENGTYLCEDTHTSYWKEFGGGYHGNSFIEYSKGLIDGLHSQYLETDEFQANELTSQIKCVSFWDSMVFIEKCVEKTKSISILA